MKKEDYRKIEYKDGRELKEGLFHKLISKREDNGEEFIKVLIETEEGILKEVSKDSIQFID